MMYMRSGTQLPDHTGWVTPDMFLEVDTKKVRYGITYLGEFYFHASHKDKGRFFTTKSINNMKKYGKLLK